MAPALAILAVLLVSAALPAHVRVLPVWVSYAVGFAVLTPMLAVALTGEHTVAAHRAHDDHPPCGSLCRQRISWSSRI